MDSTAGGTAAGGTTGGGGAAGGGAAGQRRPDWPVAVGAYAVLFVLGVMEAMIGSFQYARAPRPVPVAALVCCAGILLTCVLAAWAMRSVSGALLPGMGWVITSFVLSMPVSNGSVIITATTPGEWYLYGGTLSVAAAVVAAFALMAFGPHRQT
jgi:hypothetical protein